MSTSAFAEVHDDLRAVARDLLAAPGPVDWRRLADAGWLGLEVPEALGGAGATFAETAVILEELGRAAATAPYLGSIALGVGALNLTERSPTRDELLAGIAAGDRRVAVALADGSVDRVPGPVPFHIESTDDGPVLRGAADFVPDAAGADDLLLVALDPTRIPVLVHLPRHHPGLRVEAHPVLDATRALAGIGADRVHIGVADVARFAGDPHAAVRGLLARAATAVAVDSLGLSRAMLDATVAYAKVRVQFDRPIGSFQAVKHACADLLVSVSVTERLVSAAVAACAAGGDAAVAASMATSHACAVGVEAAGAAMQLHGGIGYTWESGIHAYLKRALLNRSLFGSPRAHRRFLGERHLAPAGEP